MVGPGEHQGGKAQVGDDLVIALDGEDIVTLIGVASADPDADDFIF